MTSEEGLSSIKLEFVTRYRLQNSETGFTAKFHNNNNKKPTESPEAMKCAAYILS
jgi:hypothetical protein